MYEGLKEQRVFINCNMAFTDISAKSGGDNEEKSGVINLLLLSEFIEKPTTTLKIFWTGISKLIRNPTTI